MPPSMSSTTIGYGRRRFWRGLLISTVVNSESLRDNFCTSSHGQRLSVRRGGLTSFMRGKIPSISGPFALKGQALFKATVSVDNREWPLENQVHRISTL